MPFKPLHERALNQKSLKIAHNVRQTIRANYIHTFMNQDVLSFSDSPDIKLYIKCFMLGQFSMLLCLTELRGKGGMSGFDVLTNLRNDEVSNAGVFGGFVLISYWWDHKKFVGCLTWRNMWLRVSTGKNVFSNDLKVSEHPLATILDEIENVQQFQVLDIVSSWGKLNSSQIPYSIYFKMVRYIRYSICKYTGTQLILHLWTVGVFG